MLEKRPTGREIAAYSFQGIAVLPLPEGVTRQPGVYQGVHFTVEASQIDWILEKIERWFDTRDEIILVDAGVTEKAGDGFITLEWDGCQIDPLFLAILRDEPFVQDFAVYQRNEEVYQ